MLRLVNRGMQLCDGRMYVATSSIIVHYVSGALITDIRGRRTSCKQLSNWIPAPCTSQRIAK